ncbi:DUF2207 domain-containing protein [Kribbella antibiotica]|uniref:DUF2207 domain-containing protein n=1 Tax=Kribbella antibiotica TaxID=190195 RepID=A0A4R4ZLP6_9ACTN|nr:DUF2207 domain-containing protein [Kribbella antibiotica]TDD57752.1 DUF2207 domain-containing protein [Kribbella antibiotica]
MRRALALLACTLLSVVWFAAPAAAVPGDRVTRLAIDYTVTPDGVLRVQETIDYHFAETGRHGIYRDLVIREPNGSDKDQRYDVSNLKVSDTFTTATTKSNGDRNEVLRIKIGSADKTLRTQDTSYRISYEVRGALRHFADHSELYWDATGSRWDALLSQVNVTATVPRGVQRVRCLAGPTGSTQPCTSARVTGGKGLYAESGVGRGEQVTIVAAIAAGAVVNDGPIVVDKPGFLDRNGLSLPAVIVSALTTAAALVIRKLYVVRDLRYDGLPPGTQSPSARTVKDTLTEDQLPVAFSPPRIPVAEAGLLLDAKTGTTEIAATLIDLAVRGVLRIDNSGKKRKAVLRHPELATAPHERRLLKGLFPGLKPGKEALLEQRRAGDSSLAMAANRTVTAIYKQVSDRGWYVRMPKPSNLGSSSVGVWLFVGVFGLIGSIIGIVALVKHGFPSWTGPVAAVGLPVIAMLSLWITLARKRAKGQRSAAGRAVTDQVIGFRKYLTTAEADQLKFEEGEDIFSKYLPWAIIFGIADRWQQVCRQLVAAGQLTPDPGWYVGPSYYDSGWSANLVTNTVASTFSDPPSPSTSSSSGDGGGSSSGFSSDSSSGGGGGGGGGGSW